MNRFVELCQFCEYLSMSINFFLQVSLRLMLLRDEAVMLLLNTMLLRDAGLMSVHVFLRLSLRRLLLRHEAGMLLLNSCVIAKMGVTYMMYYIRCNCQKASQFASQIRVKSVRRCHTMYGVSV